MTGKAEELEEKNPCPTKNLTQTSLGTNQGFQNHK
jgi:hypothetical protein